VVKGGLSAEEKEKADTELLELAAKAIDGATGGGGGIVRAQPFLYIQAPMGKNRQGG
jgi:hypothetical protein